MAARYASPRRSAGSEPRTPRPGPSTYANRFRSQGQPTIVVTYNGQWLGVECDGKFELPQPCCPDLLHCERDECWTPLREIG
jgi:hypothetical protein